MKTNTIGRLRSQGYEKLHLSMRDGTFLDLSGNKNNGTPSGANIQKSEHGSSCMFDGTNDYIRTVSSSGITTAPLTVSAWVKPMSTGSLIVYSERGDGVADFNRGFGAYIIAGQLSFTSFGVFAYPSSASSINMGVWSFCSFVLDASFDVSYYINGAYDIIRLNNTNIIAAQDYGVIGALKNSVGYPGAYTTFFNGGIDSVILHSTALSSTEVAQIMAETRPWG